MSLRRTIAEISLERLNVAEFCRQHGISTWFFYDLRRRVAAGGLEALEPRSRAPHRVANRIGEEVEDAIVALRKELVEEGLDAGPGTIAFHLQAGGGPVPSESTIWRVLVRRGFVVPDPTKAPQRSFRSFAAERANECWQIDDTPWVLANGAPVKVIDILDDCTRVAVASRVVRHCTTAAALETMGEAATEWGWPERFLSDNAKAFRHGLADALGHLSIRAGHSRPYHPQTCGKVERFHQTLKRWLAARPLAEDLAELQDQLDRFRQHYNSCRPHRSLGRRIPAQVWAERPKSGPASSPLGTSTRIYRCVVQNGTLSAGRRYVISVGVAFDGEAATVVLTATAAHVFIDGRLVRALTLDPQRRVQPLYDTPGRPPRLP